MKCLTQAARLDAAAANGQLAQYSPTTTFTQFHRSNNNSATSSPNIPSSRTLEPPLSPVVHDHNSRLRHQKSVPSIDGGGIMSIDSVRQVYPSTTLTQNCAKFIGEDGQTRIVNISECHSAKAILHKVLKKFNINDDWSNWCIFITKERGGCKPPTPHPSSLDSDLHLDSRLSDQELVLYCQDPTIPERERLILTKRTSTPGGAELRRAQAIAKEQQQSAHDKTLSERVQKTPEGQLGRTKTNKLEGFFGERPTSFQRPNSSSPPTSTVSPRDPSRPNTKRLRNFFGQRPPSELISSNLAEYFPDHEKNILEETVRNSIRRSTRMSHAGRRFSTATTASTASSFRDSEVPPVPTMGEAWIQQNRPGTATPPRLVVPRPQTRPVSMRRALSTASYANSIVESLAEEDGEGEVEGHEWSVTHDEDTIRADAMTSLPDEEPADEEEEEEDSEEEEEEYEEGEFDAVGGGPTRWIRGALIGMGSFGSVYLGMNRTSGELMAVKQVELPSHDVQGEQRKQSMLIALQREIALLRDLTHENIVHYIGTPQPLTPSFRG